MNENEMTELLARKLTKEEFRDLYVLLDSDPPAGPFYCAMGDKAIEIVPELFYDEDEAIIRKCVIFK